jgi:hypothetical protein
MNTGWQAEGEEGQASQRKAGKEIEESRGRRGPQEGERQRQYSCRAAELQGQSISFLYCSFD